MSLVDEDTSSTEAHPPGCRRPPWRHVWFALRGGLRMQAQESSLTIRCVGKTQLFTHYDREQHQSTAGFAHPPRISQAKRTSKGRAALPFIRPCGDAASPLSPALRPLRLLGLDGLVLRSKRPAVRICPICGSSNLPSVPCTAVCCHIVERRDNTCAISMIAYEENKGLPCKSVCFYTTCARLHF